MLPGPGGGKASGEYFVPVSEHKKSFRGEKMYVHKVGYGMVWWGVV